MRKDQSSSYPILMHLLIFFFSDLVLVTVYGSPDVKYFVKYRTNYTNLSAVADWYRPLFGIFSFYLYKT